MNTSAMLDQAKEMIRAAIDIAKSKESTPVELMTALVTMTYAFATAIDVVLHLQNENANLRKQLKNEKVIYN